MTLVSERTPAPATAATPTVAPPPAPRPVPPPELRPLTGRRTALLGLCWLVVALVVVALAATTLGGLKEARAQRADLTSLREQLSYAEAASHSVLGGHDAVPVPTPGSPVALLQVPRLGLQRVVREGATPGDTQLGPGHVPGTAGLGQPGNATVVGRRSAYGAAFSRLGELRPGDPLVVTTVQGQSVYRVTAVGHTRRSGELAPTADDRLTLVTAGSRGPAGWSDRLVVTAALQGKAFAATAQGVRAAVTDGHGDRSAAPTVVIWSTLLVLVAAVTVLLYRRWLVRSTYLVTTPALVALVVLLTDAVTRLLPAWV